MRHGRPSGAYRGRTDGLRALACEFTTTDGDG